MADESKNFMETTCEDRIKAAKETILVFPGIIKLYQNKENAVEYFKTSASSDPDMKKVIFEISLKADLK